MTLDWLILSACLAAALFSRHGSIVAIWFGSSLALVLWYEGFTKWSTLVDWAIYFSLKDFALMLLAGYLRTPLIIVYGLAASCIFHQVVLMQILTYNWENVTLFEYRSEFMLYLAVIMLATVIHSTIGGGSNGGRRAKCPSYTAHRFECGLLLSASQKVKK